jgi:hypothetical protein
MVNVRYNLIKVDTLCRKNIKQVFLGEDTKGMGRGNKEGEGE